MSASVVNTVPCDLYLYFLTKLALPDVIAFAQTSAVAYQLARHELRARHRRMLRRFVSDPDAFLRALDASDALISGSFALNYVAGEGSWSSTDLDLYANPERFRVLLDYLVNHEGYRALARPDVIKRKMTAEARRKK